MTCSGHWNMGGSCRESLLDCESINLCTILYSFFLSREKKSYQENKHHKSSVAFTDESLKSMRNTHFLGFVGGVYHSVVYPIVQASLTLMVSY